MFEVARWLRFVFSIVNDVLTIPVLSPILVLNLLDKEVPTDNFLNNLHKAVIVN